MMLKIFKLILLSSFILQTSCEITFKRKNMGDDFSKTITNNLVPNKKLSKEEKKRIKDFSIISKYYSDAANTTIRNEMITHTEISKKQEKQLIVDKIISRDIQVMPLPIELERMLSNLTLNHIRVQAGVHIILMDVKTRRIIYLIKI